MADSKEINPFTSRIKYSAIDINVEEQSQQFQSQVLSPPETFKIIKLEGQDRIIPCSSIVAFFTPCVQLESLNLEPGIRYMVSVNTEKASLYGYSSSLIGALKEPRPRLKCEIKKSKRTLVRYSRDIYGTLSTRSISCYNSVYLYHRKRLPEVKTAYI